METPQNALTPELLARMIDHSLLQPFLTDEDIRAGCALAARYGTASVCVRPSDLPLAAALLRGTPVRVSTVIGFPHGAHASEIKLLEARHALDAGAVELDMVQNIGKLRSGEYAYVEREIAQVCALAHSRGAIVKLILENCFLSDDQKREACRIAERAGADFVKTSTGYGKGGATLADLKLMRETVSERVRVKAAGGVRTLDALLSVRAVGCARCGATATQAMLDEAEARYARGELTMPETPSELGGAY